MKQTLLILCICLFLSCNTREDRTILRLATDLPEVLPLIEQFNIENSNIKIVTTPITSKETPDIIIYEGHSNISSMNLADLSPLLKEKIDRESFYTDIIKSVIKDDGSIEVLPLAFDIPGFMYNKNRFSNKRVIPIESFLENETIKFSPYWDKNFIIWYYLSNSPSFNKDEQFLDLPLFLSTSNKMKRVIANNKDKWNEELFNKKYLHLSPALLIESNTIEYYYINFKDFVTINSKYSKNINFSFISNNDLVIANDSLIYTGIFKDSKNRSKAEEFLIWIFNKKNQNSYITNNIKDAGLTSLFLGRLSTLKVVSEELIPYHYPTIAPFIPKSDVVTIPNNLPPLWGSLKKQVFLPAFSESQASLSGQLKDKYHKLYIEWFKKHKK